MTAVDDRAQEIGANFLAWTIDTGPCPISINDMVWFKRLCGLFETQATLESENARLREAARWIPVDSGEAAPKGAHGVLTFRGVAYWVRKPEAE